MLRRMTLQPHGIGGGTPHSDRRVSMANYAMMVSSGAIALISSMSLRSLTQWASMLRAWPWLLCEACRCFARPSRGPVSARPHPRPPPRTAPRKPGGPRAVRRCR